MLRCHTRLRQRRRKSANLQNNLDLPKTHLLNSHWSEPVTRCGARSTLWHRGCRGWNVWFDYIVCTVRPLSSDWSAEPILSSDWLTRAPCLALSIGQCKCQLPPSLISLIASSEVTTRDEERAVLTGGEGYLTNQQNTLQPSLRLEFNSKRRKHSIKRYFMNRIWNLVSSQHTLANSLLGQWTVTTLRLLQSWKEYSLRWDHCERLILKMR